MTAAQAISYDPYVLAEDALDEQDIDWTVIEDDTAREAAYGSPEYDELHLNVTQYA